MICPECGKETNLLIKRKDGKKMCWWCDGALPIPKKNKVKRIRGQKPKPIRKFHRLFPYGSYKVSYEEITGDIYRVAIYNDSLELVMSEHVFKMDMRELQWYLQEVLHETHTIL